jgi:excisionase family DNA binding protein
MTKELLTAQELATHLKIKAGTVALWTRQGRIPARRLSRKVVRYDLAQVLAALAARESSAALAN